MLQTVWIMKILMLHQYIKISKIQLSSHYLPITLGTSKFCSPPLICLQLLHQNIQITPQNQKCKYGLLPSMSSPINYYSISIIPYKKFPKLEIKSNGNQGMHFGVVPLQPNTYKIAWMIQILLHLVLALDNFVLLNNVIYFFNPYSFGNCKRCSEGGY